jgi:hypothetical protein
MECPHCKVSNPDGKHFCGDCGSPLDPTVGRMVRDQVEEILSERFKEQKVVEIETTQAIASRLSDWAKLFAFFVGIPVAALLAIVGMLGIRTYSDFSEKVQKAQNDVIDRLTLAQAAAKKLKSDSDSLAADYQKLQERYADTKAIADQLQSLSAKVDRLEKLAFTTSSEVAPDLKATLEDAFAKYQQYLRKLGYAGTTDITIDIRKAMNMSGTISYYDPNNQMMVVDSRYASDPLVLYREYSHHVLYSSRKWSNSAEGEWPYDAIESGLAWYFPCSFVGDAHPATEVTSWDLSKRRKFDEIKPNVTSAMVDGTEIWGGAFWDMLLRSART